MRELAAQSGINVLADVSALEANRNGPVTATLTNVALDTAVHLLADMSGMRAVVVGNALYVTTPERARGLAEEQEQRARKQRRRAKESKSAPVAAAKKLVQLTFSKRPLDRAFEEVSKASGIAVVMDSRLAEKVAKAFVTTKFENISGETAVRLLADMSELAAVPIEDAFYITSRENAHLNLENGAP